MSNVEIVAWFVSDPKAFVMRRVEYLEFSTDRNFSVRVVQDIVFPRQTDKYISNDSVPLILGFFRKMRLPDLSATDASGKALPVLNRDERAQYVAMAVLLAAQRRFFDQLETDDTKLGRVVWGTLQKAVEFVVVNSESRARTRVEKTYLALQSLEEIAEVSKPLKRALRTLLADEELWTSIARLCEVIPHFCWAPRPSPGERVVLQLTYSEPVVYPYLVSWRRFKAFVRGFRFHTKLRYLFRRGAQTILKKLLEIQGIIPTTVTRFAANSGQARSLWIMMTPPQGVEVVRAFWQDEGDLRPSREVQIASGARAVVSRRSSIEQESPEGARVNFDIQLSPAGEFWSTDALLFLLFLVSASLYRRLPSLWTNPSRDGVTGVIAAYAAIPGAIVTTIAYRSHSLTLRLARGFKFLLLVASGAAIALAGSFAFRGPDALTSRLTIVLSGLALPTCFSLAILQCGPRWRHGEHSRFATRTERASPFQCRQKQWRTTVILWSLLCVILSALSVIAEVVSRRYRIRDSRFWTTLSSVLWSWTVHVADFLIFLITSHI